MTADPAYTGAVPPPSYKLPFHQRGVLDYETDQVQRAHNEALYAYGEYAMFVLLWTPQDYEHGRVMTCSTCSSNRYADAYQQATRERCPNCFGTRFEGGYRAQIIRPALFTDRMLDTVDSPRGSVVTNNMTVESVGDFTLHHGDYVFRADGKRFQTEEMGETIVRSGFDVARSTKSMAGVVASVRMEAEASVAYIVPPPTESLKAILDYSGIMSSHLPPDLAQYETVRAGGYIK